VAHYGSKAYLLFRSNHISMMVCFERPFGSRCHLVLGWCEFWWLFPA